MNHPEISKLARLMKPQILVHIATGGSLRGCAQAKGILALTVEIGSASVFQIPLILATYAGIRRVITSLGMAAEYNPSEEIIDVSVNLGLDKTAVCTRSASIKDPTFW
jgi:predicted deacylase